MSRLTSPHETFRDGKKKLAVVLFQAKFPEGMGFSQGASRTLSAGRAETAHR